MISHDTRKHVLTVLRAHGFNPYLPSFADPQIQAEAVQTLIGEGMGEDLAVGFVRSLAEIEDA